jgi:hypothetical protein
MMLHTQRDVHGCPEGDEGAIAPLENFVLPWKKSTHGDEVKELVITGKA